MRPVEPDARRLIVASVLRLHVASILGTGPVGDDVGGAAAALCLVDDTLARRHGLAFEPGYPGVDADTAAAGGPARLVLVCRATHRGEPAAVVVTTLIPGRAPQVTAAPPNATPPR